MNTARAFIPAAGRDWLLPIYDPITSLLGFDEARRELVAQAALQGPRRAKGWLHPIASCRTAASRT